MVELFSFVGLSEVLARQPVDNWKVKFWGGQKKTTCGTTGYDGTSLSP